MFVFLLPELVFAAQEAESMGQLCDTEGGFCCRGRANVLRI